MGISIPSANNINLETFIDDFIVSCNEGGITCASITHTFDDFYKFFSIDKNMEDWVKMRCGSIEYSDNYAIITIEPQQLVELEIKELHEYLNSSRNYTDFDSEDLKDKIQKRLENLEIYKNFFVYLDSACSKSGKKIECVVRLILRIRNLIN